MSRLDTIIIKACLNGGRGREDNPNIPWTPEEVAQEAVRCHEAGASIVHIHARNPDGGTSYETDWYAQTDGLIRSRCDLVLNHTTARRADVPVEAVTRYLLETPNPVEMVSLNLGQGARWAPVGEGGSRLTTISPNSYEDIIATLDACYRRGTFPEPAVHDPAPPSDGVIAAKAVLLAVVAPAGGVDGKFQLAVPGEDHLRK